MPSLAIDLVTSGKRTLSLANPVMTASGTFANGIEYQRNFDIQRLGAIVSKAITRYPRKGNVQPRIAETAAGMVNSIGLQNIGIEAILKDVAPVWATWSVPVIANIAGETVDDYAYLARRLDGVPGVAAIEVNISCPNVETGMEFGVDPRAAAEVTQAVRRESGLPVVVKLTPSVNDIVSIARAVVGGGADALTLINTYPAMKIDIQTRRPALGWGSGGLSGPALKPIAVRLVYQVARAVDIPIIGCGGVTTTEDAVEFLMAGATAVQVGTATFRNPRAALDVVEGLEAWLKTHQVENVHQVIGAAQPQTSANMVPTPDA